MLACRMPFNCTTRWCTFRHFLQNNTEFSEFLLKKRIKTFSPPHHYNGIKNDEFDFVVVPMMQRYLRGKLKKVIWKGTKNYYETKHLLRKNNKIREMQEPYKKYFKNYIASLRKAMPKARILIILLPVPDTNTTVNRYGNYTDHLNTATLKRTNYKSLKKDKLTSFFDISEFINKTNLKLTQIYPWINFDKATNKLFRDMLHFSNFFINILAREIENFIKKNKNHKFAFKNNGEILPNKQRKIKNKSIKNSIPLIDKMAIQLLETKQSKQNLLKQNNFDSLADMLEWCESQFLRKKPINDNMLTLNITGYQSISLNILYNWIKKESGFNKKDLYEIVTYFKNKIAKCRKGSNLKKYYRFYLDPFGKLSSTRTY